MRRRLDFNLILLSLLAIFAIAPLMRPGFFQAHSGFLPVLNLFDLEGALPTLGWAPRIGQGGNPFLGEGPLPYALAEAFRLLGLSGVQAVRAAYALAFLLSGWALYLLGRRLFGPSGGLLAALVYIYLPYHIAVVYVRGGFAEAVAFALYPLLLLALERVMEGSNLARALSIILFAALMLTQLGTAIIFAIFLLVYSFVLGPSRRSKGRTAATLGLGLGLGGVLLLPTFLAEGWALGPAPGFSHHFLYPFQLFSPLWGYGVSRAGWDDGFPFQLGAMATGLGLLSAMALSRGKGAPRRKVVFFLSAAGAMAFLTLGFTRPLWEVMRLSWLLSYPWQLLALIGLSLSLAGGGFLNLEPRLARFPWQATLVALTVLASYNYLSPRFLDFEPSRPALGIFESRAALLDCKLEGPLRHGATIRLTLYWQALREMEEDYTVFVHVVDEEGIIWGQWDSQPASGERPTSGWELGEVIEDPYKISIDVEGPREGYRIRVGIYLVETGGRLPTEEGGSFISLEPEEVSGG